MARKQAYSAAAAAPAAAAPAAAPAAAAPAANVFAALVAPAAPAAAPAAKVHSVSVAHVTYKAANHVATFKGVRSVAAGGTAYTLTGNAYTPADGHINALQWQAVRNAIAANGGSATLAQIAECFAAAGLAAGLAPAFVKYRAKGAKPNLQAA